MCDSTKHNGLVTHSLYFDFLHGVANTFSVRYLKKKFKPVLAVVVVEKSTEAPRRWALDR